MCMAPLQAVNTIRRLTWSLLSWQTLTPVQHARCMVSAAPHLPDILYICSQLYVEEHGLPPDHLDLLPDMDAICSDMSSYGCDACTPLCTVLPVLIAYQTQDIGSCAQSPAFSS